MYVLEILSFPEEIWTIQHTNPSASSDSENLYTKLGRLNRRKLLNYRTAGQERSLNCDDDGAYEQPKWTNNGLSTWSQFFIVLDTYFYDDAVEKWLRIHSAIFAESVENYVPLKNGPYLTKNDHYTLRRLSRTCGYSMFPNPTCR